MAITASIAMTPTAITMGVKATATVTINNSGGTAVNVLFVEPNAAPNGATQGSVPVGLGRSSAGGQGTTLSVSAGGSATTTFDVWPVAPLSGVYAANPFPSGVTPAVPLSNPAQQVLAIGALVATSDGALTNASTATLTINGPTR